MSSNYMSGTKSTIIARLEKEILPLQSFKNTCQSPVLDMAPGPIKAAFHQNSFPTGAIHEFIMQRPEDAAATFGFVGTLLAALMKTGRQAVWIGRDLAIFPPSLRNLGVSADKIIFLELKKEKEILWAAEEALKCEGLAAVIADTNEFNFTASRRLQLAVEQSGVTGFILLNDPRKINITTSVARWKISSLPSQPANGLPGVGFPRWQIELLRVRNGKPGSWEVECTGNRIRHVDPIIPFILPIRRKTG